jgi:hypothetical protein
MRVADDAGDRADIVTERRRGPACTWAVIAVCHSASTLRNVSLREMSRALVNVRLTLLVRARSEELHVCAR